MLHLLLCVLCRLFILEVISFISSSKSFLAFHLFLFCISLSVFCLFVCLHKCLSTSLFRFFLYLYFSVYRCFVDSLTLFIVLFFLLHIYLLIPLRFSLRRLVVFFFLSFNTLVCLIFTLNPFFLSCLILFLIFICIFNLLLCSLCKHIHCLIEFKY